MGWTSILVSLLPAVLAALLLWAGVEDVRRRTIANAKNAAIALLAPVWWAAAGLGVWPDMAVQLGIGLSMLFLFALAFRAGMMGGGDVKMIAALALWFPWPRFLELLVVMSLAGGAITVAMLIERRWKGGDVEVPYGVAIAIAGLLALREPLLNQSL